MSDHLHKYFALCGLALVGLFAWALNREVVRDWVAPQKEYVKIVERQNAVQGREEAVVLPRIQQLDLRDLNRIDRCTTCHLGVDDPGFKDASTPLTAHSGRYLEWHPIEEYGCTACHGGQGMATSFRGAAHEELPHWEEPILPLTYTEANCGTCHTSRDVPRAPLLSEGRHLIARSNCAGCHEIPGYREDEVWGVPFGSELDDIGIKVNRNWLVQWLKDPRLYLDRPRMPQFHFSDEQIGQLAAFLMSQRKRSVQTLPAGFEARGDAERGGARFRESRCISCHAIKGKGGNLAPDLGRIVNKVDLNWFYSFIKNPHYYAPHTKMLEYNFSEQDLLDIVAYVREEFADPDFPQPSGVLAKQPTPEEAESWIPAGRKLFQESGCMGCHTLDGVKNPGRSGPSLAFVGSRTPETLDFGEVHDVKPNLANWLLGKLADPRRYQPKSKMPDFHFTEQESAKITIALMSLKDVRYDAKRLVSVERAPKGIFNPSGGPFNPQGEFGRLFTKFRCFSCHQVYGRGGTLSTAPLDREGSQVKKEWLVQYLQVPYAVRPMVIERMPRFRMTPEEAELMANYIASVFVDDAVPIVDEGGFTDGERAQGQYLFRRYGCRNCHIAGTKDGGYVGPDLTTMGNRLQAGWVMEWLKNPRRYRPDTIQPVYGLDDGEARALAAYLMSLKGKKTP